MAYSKVCTLNTGNEMPTVILATQMVDGSDVAEYVSLGLQTGLRHIDTAWIYGNESEIGQGIAKSGIPRSELFISNRIWAIPQRPESVQAGLESSLKNLGTNYVDLCIMHWPAPFGSAKDPRATSLPLAWKVMERLFKTGKAKAIGVSNLTIELMSSLMATAEIQPSVCQVECTPFNQQLPLQDLCASKNIRFWSAPPVESTESVPNKDRSVTLWTFDIPQNSTQKVTDSTNLMADSFVCY